MSAISSAEGHARPRESAVGLVFFAMLAWAYATHVAPPSTTFPLAVAVAEDAIGMPVAGDAWLEDELRVAAALFAPFGVGFTIGDSRTLAFRFAHLETRADRDALAAQVEARLVNVFVVGSLRDVDDPVRLRKGVHWHAPSGAHYVVLVAGAPASVLGHELGHFFGNPHSQVVDNVMSYERGGGPVFFDADQGRRIGARARRYLDTGELLPMPANSRSKLP